jgi:LacI family transcriptional regulator
VMTLGIIQWISPIEESNDPYYLSIRQGVEEYCFKNKIAIKRVFKTDIDYLNQLEDIQGLVCIGKYSQEDIETYKKICSNVIFLDMNIDPIHECCILLDFKNAVKDVVSYLSQKHTSIAYLGGKEIIHDKLYHDQRKEYFEHYCKEYNIDYSMSEEAFSIESGFNMTYELIKNKKLPSAIFAASDPIAIGAMRALKQYDIKIPEDISIIGFDNIETTNYTDPPLTTVFAPTFDMGFMAARQLFDAFKHNENISPIKILLPCFLIERNSCI